MPNFIDRRLNPKDRSLGNRQRFLRRARAQIKEVVNQSLKDRSITDVDGGQTISIPTKGIGEPRFHHAPTGRRSEQVFTGNKEFIAGDKIQKPKGGGGGQGKQATDSGEGEDEFQFVLSREEFLDLFFEDLELPDLVRVRFRIPEREAEAWSEVVVRLPLAVHSEPDQSDPSRDVDEAGEAGDQ